MLAKFCTFLARVTYAKVENRLDRESPALGLAAARLAARESVRRGQTDANGDVSPKENALVLCCPSHVVVRIVCELEDVWGQENLAGGRVPVFCGILVQDRV